MGHGWLNSALLFIAVFSISYHSQFVPWKVVFSTISRVMSPVIRTLREIKISLVLTAAATFAAHLVVLREWGAQPHWAYITGLALVCGAYSARILYPYYISQNAEFMKKQMCGQTVEMKMNEMKVQAEINQIQAAMRVAASR